MTPASGPPPPPPPEQPSAPAGRRPVPAFDPYNAQKSIELGRFYMDKGDYDAAIARFQDAAQYQPKLALPWELLGRGLGKGARHRKGHRRVPEISGAAPARRRLGQNPQTRRETSGRCDATTAERVTRESPRSERGERRGGEARRELLLQKRLQAMPIELVIDRSQNVQANWRRPYRIGSPNARRGPGCAGSE